MRRLLALASAALCFSALAGSLAGAAERKPNIIVLLGDDLGYSDLGAQGGKVIPTPNIDSIAQNGVRCTQGYVSGPYCSPTRAGLITGRYQTRFGHEFNEGQNTNRETFGLPLSETTFAQRLKALGDATGAVGKWHLGFSVSRRPTNRGYDEFLGTLANTPYFHPTLVDSRVGPDPKRVEENSVQWKGHLPAAKVYEPPVIQLEILPTVVAAAGGEVSPDWKLDGVNLLPYLKDEAKGVPHESLYWRFGPQWAVRRGDWKLVQGYDYDADQAGLSVAKTKVTSPMLFNLARDLGETTDLSAKHPDRVKALQAAWQSWNQELIPPAWIPGPPKS